MLIITIALDLAQLNYKRSSGIYEIQTIYLKHNVIFANKFM